MVVAVSYSPTLHECSTISVTGLSFRCSEWFCMLILCYDHYKKLIQIYSSTPHHQYACITRTCAAGGVLHICELYSNDKQIPTIKAIDTISIDWFVGWLVFVEKVGLLVPVSSWKHYCFSYDLTYQPTGLVGLIMPKPYLEAGFPLRCFLSGYPSRTY